MMLASWKIPKRTLLLWVLLALSLPGRQVQAVEKSVPVHPHGPEIGDCAPCHAPDAWKPARISNDFNHATRGMTLDGAHARIECRACHRSLDFRLASTECAACHADPHGGEFGSDCSRCHTTRNFIDHAREIHMHRTTRFPLTATHLTLACEACHLPAGDGKLVYVGTPTECFACHTEDYQTTRQPDHAALGFSTDCSQCHSPVGWSATRINHDATGFPLRGAHAAQNCAACHTDGTFTGLSSECVSCHLNDYTATTSPDHTASGFSTDCATCHGTVSWNGAVIDHDATGFPLRGAHATLDCLVCHAGGVYSGLGTACETCHLDDYMATTSPNHAAAGFPTDCSACHGTVAWEGAVFNHDATGFPLRGAHTSLSCEVCHVGGVYSGLSSECVTCHLDDYTATTSPNHAAAGFSTDCAACHGTNTWLGATFDHDGLYFPIYSGPHRGKWSDCAVCHTNSGNYAVFSCFGCHPHSDQSGTDSHHTSVSGYVYESTACYACHPQGRH